MRPSEFIARIGKGQIESAYFFLGPDRLMHDECRKALIHSLAPDVREWCLAEIEFEADRLSSSLDGARQLPMLGGRNVLIFSDTEDFKRATDGDVEALTDYLAKPSAASTVVFAASRPDRRRKFIQLLEKKALPVEMHPPSLAEAAAWAREFFRRAGVELDGPLAQELAARFETTAEQGESAGVNTMWMRTEMEKLLAARPGEKRISRQDLDFIVSFREEHEIGKLLRAVAERDFRAALGYLRALQSGKTSEALILWSLAELFRQAIQNAGASSKGYGGWGARANPLAIFSLAPVASQRFSRSELLRALKLVRWADLSLKSSWKDSALLLEALAWQIVTGQDASASRDAAGVQATL